MVKMKNIWDETLAFAGVPALNPWDTIEISEDMASILANHPSIEILKGKVKGVEKDKDTFKGVEA